MIVEVNIPASLVAGIAAMIPGAIIYNPAVMGATWMNELSIDPEVFEKQKQEGDKLKNMLPMMFTLLLFIGIALVISLFMYATESRGISGGITISLLCCSFMVASILFLVFFEKRSWILFGISSINYTLAYLVMGIVLGLFIK